MGNSVPTTTCINSKLESEAKPRLELGQSDMGYRYPSGVLATVPNAHPRTIKKVLNENILRNK